MNHQQQQGKDVLAPGDNQVMLRHTSPLDASYKHIVLFWYRYDHTFANSRAESVFRVNVPKGPSTFEL